MDVSEFSFLGGLLLGLASSLHCAGMCGGIAASFVMLADPASGAQGRLRLLAATQAGKLVAYVVAGALVGALGSAFYGLFDRTALFRILQWAAAVTLVWIGLATAGLLPALTVVDRFTAPLARRIAAGGASVSGSGRISPLLAGFVWGLAPCAMVYGALFTAMMTGDAWSGARVMLGFGLGTVPAVTATALGISSLRRLAHGQMAAVLIGLAIAAFGVMGLLLTVPGSPFCITS